jgi:hypothetical protein
LSINAKVDLILIKATKGTMMNVIDKNDIQQAYDSAKNLMENNEIKSNNSLLNLLNKSNQLIFSCPENTDTGITIYEISSGNIREIKTNRNEFNFHNDEENISIAKFFENNNNIPQKVNQNNFPTFNKQNNSFYFNNNNNHSMNSNIADQKFPSNIEKAIKSGTKKEKIVKKITKTDTRESMVEESVGASAIKEEIPEETTSQKLFNHLFEACNILRGPINQDEFKSYVTPILFFQENF